MHLKKKGIFKVKIVCDTNKFESELFERETAEAGPT